MKPDRPSRISARRPRRSARCAQTGAITTQTTADREKAIATQMSATPSSRPIAGSSDCIAVLPAAATSITEKSRANRSRERPKPFICQGFPVTSLAAQPAADFPVGTAARGGQRCMRLAKRAPICQRTHLSANIWNDHVGILGRST